MDFIDHPNCNHSFGKPKDWDDEKATCDTLPVCVAIDPNLGQVLHSYWAPTPEEMNELINGGTIRLTIVGQGHPVVCMGVEPKVVIGPEYKCKFCGAPSYIEPSEQEAPPDYCHESDHGSPE